MKKLAIIALALAIVVIPSCNGNKGKKSENNETKKEVSQKEKNATELLKVNLQAFVESAKQFKPVSFATKDEGGKIVLSDKEKMVKPDYLLPLSEADGLVTLTQKYRALAIYATDNALAKLYDMPLNDYKAVMGKLLASINDPALEAFANEDLVGSESYQAALETLLNAENEAGRTPLTAQMLSATLVEQVYILTQNIDKFLPMFDDQVASDVTFNFICVHESIMSMMEFYPELESLNTIMTPLYAINAINVDQLKEQLIGLKAQTEAIRANILK